MSKRYSIHLSYDATQWPDGDNTYEKIVGRSSDSSGMGMGERDLIWDLSSKKRAMSLFDKLSSLRNNNLILVSLSMNDDD